MRWSSTRAARSEKSMRSGSPPTARGVRKPRRRRAQARGHARMADANKRSAHYRVSRHADDRPRTSPCHALPDRALPEHRYLGAHRRRQDHDDRAHPVLHRRLAQDREVHDGAAVMTTWSRSRSAHHDHAAATTAFWKGMRTSSRAPLQHHRTPGTSTSRSKSSAACACSTRLRRVLRRERRAAAVRDVWRQMNKYGVPRLAFVNKMDRAGATSCAARADPTRLRGNRSRCSCRSARGQVRGCST